MASIMLQNDVTKRGSCISRALVPENMHSKTAGLMLEDDDVHVSTASRSIQKEGFALVTQNPNNCRVLLLQNLPSGLNGALGAHHMKSLSGNLDVGPQSLPATTCVDYNPGDAPSSIRARRVIFPWLHLPCELPPASAVVEPVLERDESVPSDRQPKPLPSEILLLLTSPNPVHRTEESMCRSNQITSTRSNRYGIQLEALQIPPFKGVVYPSESSTLAATSLRPESTPKPKFSLPCQSKVGQKKPLRSILRSKSDRTVDCKQLALDFSVRRSSLPRLMSLKDEEDDSQSSTETPESSQSSEECPDSDSSFSRSSSRVISFDPRVWVREFQRSEDEKRSIWYSPKDLERFKSYTLNRIMEYRGRQLFATGTGRSVQAPVPVSKAVYTNPALTLESEADDLKDETTPFQSAVLECEIRNILIVDPHDICLKLLEKSFKRIIPHANVITARTSKEALQHYFGSAQPFDVVIVEERLHFFQRQDSNSSEEGGLKSLSSGSSLVRKLASANGGSLFIGISAKIDKEKAKLQESGADLIWSKPPPIMNSNIRNTILKTILLKRGRRALALALFGAEESS